jgi:ATP/maltotriose-dependent transcriptional regulator MalT
MERQTLRPSGVGRFMSRPRLTELFHGQKPPVTLVVAPAGFGKSVTASQLSTVRADAAVLWLDLGGQDPDPGELAAVVARLICEDAVEGDAILGHPLPPEAPEVIPVVVGRLREATRGRPAVLVLDNVGLTRCFADLAEVLGALRQATGDESQLVVTSRALGSTAGAANLQETWFVDADDLRLSDEEARRFVVWMGADSVTLGCSPFWFGTQGHWRHWVAPSRAAICRWAC